MVMSLGGDGLPWYPEEKIEEVRSRSDIVRVIGRYVNLKRTGSSYMGLCPFHSEKSPSFNVSPSRQMYKCFGCGVGGNVFTFLMEYENLTFTEVVEELAEQTGVDLPKQEMTAEQKKQESIRQVLLEINKKAARYYFALLKSPAGEAGYRYLTQRGLTDETILHFGLGFAGQGGGELYHYMKKEGYDDSILKQTGLFTMDERGAYDKFWNRVIFPIMDANSRVIGFGGRVMGDAKPKYLNSPETKIFDKSRNLFGLNYAKKGIRKNLILCEGYMDVIALHQAGFTNAVASLGTAFTPQQANLIRRYTDEVLLTYDSDEAGIKAAMRGIPILRKAGIHSRIVHMEPYKDPDEFIKNRGQDAFQQQMDEAQNSFFFEIEVVKKSYSMTDPEQKTQFVHEMAKRLLVFEDKILRDSYMEALSAKYGVPSEDLKQLVVRYGNRMPAGYEEVMEERRQEQKRSRSKRENKEGIGYSYSILLSWMIEEPSLFDQICQWVTPQDFEEGIYRTVAVRLYEQLEQGEVVPARIIGLFQEVEEQNQVASMFQTNFGSQLDQEGKKKAITDLVIKIKEHSLEQQAGQVTDLNQLQELVQQKKALQNAVKLHIS
jgi:DNA primase